MDNSLFHSWNNETEGNDGRKPIIVDDTLRDGLQAPFVVAPTLEEKLILLDKMSQNHVDVSVISYPASSEKAMRETEVILRHLKANGSRLKPALAGRTHINDLAPIANLQERVGIRLTAYAFIGCSPIRQMVEGWDMPFLRKAVTTSISYLKERGVEPILVVEDSTRAKPEDLKTLIGCS